MAHRPERRGREKLPTIRSRNSLATIPKKGRKVWNKCGKNRIIPKKGGKVWNKRGKNWITAMKRKRVNRNSGKLSEHPSS